MLEKDLPMLCLSVIKPTLWQLISRCAPLQTVVMAFWSIYLYDRELIFPASVDDIIHPLVNHALVYTNTSFYIVHTVTCTYVCYETHSHLVSSTRSFFLSLLLKCYLYITVVQGTERQL